MDARVQIPFPAPFILLLFSAVRGRSFFIFFIVLIGVVFWVIVLFGLFFWVFLVWVCY